MGTVVTLLLSPLRIYEKHVSETSEVKLTMHDSPVFIIGHWRSGTTFMHNLLSLDPQFGYLSYVQAQFPHSFKNRFIMWCLKLLLPPTRPMDNVEIDIGSPQEEEMAMIASCGHSLYNMWIAPDKQLECWRDYGLLEDESPCSRWIYGYIRLLKKVSFHHAGKRLLLKSPSPGSTLFSKTRWLAVATA